MSTPKRSITVMGVLVFLSACAGLAGAQSMTQRFTADLAAAPGVNSGVTGTATFMLSRDGSELDYTLSVTDGVYSPTNAPYYAALALTTSPSDAPSPVARLFPEMPPGYLDPVREAPPVYLNAQDNHTYDGRLAMGAITQIDLIGPLAGKSMSDLINDIKSGSVSVIIEARAFPDGFLEGAVG